MKSLLMLLLISCCTVVAIAQDKTNSDQPNGLQGKDYDWSWKSNTATPFTPPPPDPIPVDGGVGFLIAAGSLWGVKNLRRKKKKS